MEDVTVNDVECTECGNLFEMLAEDFEEAEEMYIKSPGKRFIRCPDCQAKALNEQIESEKPPKRCFEYLIEGAYNLERLNELGQDGWEAISMMGNPNLLFKREYYVKEI